MKEQFVSYEIALALKELGFDEECLAYYKDGKLAGVNKWDRKDFEFHSIVQKDITNTVNEVLLAPLWQQAIDWFKERNIILYVEHSSGVWTGVVEYSEEYFEKDFDEDSLDLSKKGCYYLAKEWMILKAIELCQKKN